MTPSESKEEPAPDADVPPKLRREFLLQAGLLNLGVLAGGGGFVVLGFTDRLGAGLGLLGLGAVGLLLTWVRYRREVAG
ncbi:MAG: hypothetical protein ABEJ85_05740 [Haloarculaceae archaeon]